MASTPTTTPATTPLTAGTLIPQTFCVPRSNGSISKGWRILTLCFGVYTMTLEHGSLHLAKAVRFEMLAFHNQKHPLFEAYTFHELKDGRHLCNQPFDFESHDTGLPWIIECWRAYNPKTRECSTIYVEEFCELVSAGEIPPEFVTPILDQRVAPKDFEWPEDAPKVKTLREVIYAK
jgi:hypothetical protein